MHVVCVCVHVVCVCVYVCMCESHFFIQHLELTLPESRKGVTLDQRMAETEGYYQLLHEQVQSMLQSLNTTEEASQIQQTAKTMLESLRQCIDTMKDIQVCRLNICDAIATAFRAWMSLFHSDETKH